MFSLCLKVKVKVAQLYPTLLWPYCRYRPMHSPGQSLQPFPSPANLPNPGIEPESPALQVHSLPTELFREAHNSTEKAMAPHSSTLAWKIPWMEEPGRLQSMGLLRVERDWATSLSLFTFMHWRRKWQPAPVFLPGESQGQWSLMGCCLWGCTESDTTEAA